MLTKEELERLQTITGDSSATAENGLAVLLSFAEHTSEAYAELYQEHQNLSAANPGSSTLELSAADREALDDRVEMYSDKIDLSVAVGDTPKFVADKLKKLLKKGDNPNVFMLSRNAAIDGRPIEMTLALFKDAKLGLVGPEGSKLQMLGRNTPSGSKAEAGKFDENPLIIESRRLSGQAEPSAK